MRRNKILTLFLCLITSLGFLFTVASCKTSSKTDEFIITFDSRGGSQVATQKVQKGEKITKPEDPTKDKYFFENWYKEIDYKNVWNFDVDLPESDTILYAKWNMGYIMTFDTQGAGIIIDQSVKEGGKAVKPADPKKEHYSFGGWYKEPNCLNAWDFETDCVTKNTIIYAKWTINTYTVTFEANGGTSVLKQNVVAKQKATRPASPTRDGYLFIGWYTDIELKKQFDFVNTEIIQNLTLYAKWEETTQDPNKLIVIFNSKLGSEVPNLENVVPGSKIAKPADPVREGYTFLGWYKDTDGELVEEFNFAEDRVTENLTLYAKWERAKFTVSFDSNGGSIVASQSVEVDGKATRPTSPTKEGYTFIGWYKDTEFKNVFDFVNTTITEDITLYAQWKVASTDPNKLEVIFISKGGSEVPSITGIISGSKIEKPSDPVRDGYTFLGWYKDTDGELVEEFNFEEETITESIVLYAKWEIKKYALVFDSNGGSSVASQSVNYGELATRPTTPTKEGYIFIGWYSDAELKHEFDFVNTTILKDYTLYAKWELGSESEDRFKVYFNSKGGSAVPTLENIAYGSKIEKPEDPVRDGYTFLGWYKDEQGALVDRFDFTKDTITEDITLFAKWTITTYLVTFDVDGGSSIASQNVNIHGKVIPPSHNPVKANHTFIGWYKDKACTMEWNFSEDTIISNTTIYAKWEKNPVTEDVEIKFPFAQFNSSVPKDSELKTTVDFEIGQFKVSAGAKSEPAMLNSQGKDIYFTLNGKFSNGLKIVGTGGSTKADTIVTLYKDTNTLIKVLGTAALNGGSFAATIDGLEAGTYRLKTVNSLKITVFTLYEYNQAIEVAVKFETFNGSVIQDAIVPKWSTLTKPEDPTKDGYVFKGWFIDEACETIFDFNSKLDSDITLYAKWEEKPLDPSLPIYGVTYETNGGSTIPAKNVNEGGKVAAPTNPVREGYFFIGWYDDPNFEQEHNFELPIMDNITIYARWEEKPIYITFENTSLDILEIKKGTKVPKPLENPTKPNFIFAGWYKDNTFQEEFDFDTPLYVDTRIYAKWEKDPDASDYIEAGPGQILEKGAVELVRAVGQVEGAYITFRPYAGATDYTITLRNTNNTTSKILDENYMYIRTMNDGILRADILGLPAGSYEAIVYPKGDESAKGSSCMFTVGEYDRSGYAHFNYTEGVGAYDDTGALKKNAIVLWVTDENKNTISLTYKGTTVVGIGNILNSVGEDVGGGVTSKGGKANTNQGIMKKLAEDNIPLVVRFIGTVSNTGLYKKAAFAAASKPKIDGLTIYDSLDWGGSIGDNGHMARIKSGKDVTLEGVGENAVIDGWGFHYMAESSAPDLGKSFEIRNLTFINTPEDAIGMEGVQLSANVNSILTASVERCWIHNNEFYGPTITDPAESDKGEGDGSCDFKRGQYFTCSYNYFEGCHKTNLVGSADSSLQYNLTYHHNYWKLCKARGPLARNANIHMYNNLFEEQTDYAMNTRANSYIFSEYNMFYKCKNAQAVEGGAIKSFKDSFATTLQNKGSAGTIVENKTDIVPNSCKFAAEGIDYSKFDTNPMQSYIPSGEYVLQTSVTEARKAIYAFTGVRRAQNVSMMDVDMSYISVLPTGVSPVNVDTYPTTLTPGKISKTVYAFTISRSATIKISYGTAVGVMVNQAGECMLTGSGSTTVKAGTYIVQAQNFQPGDSKALTLGTFKDMNIDSIEIVEHDDGAELIADYDAKAKKIPSTIQYTSTCYQAIVAAKQAYAVIPAEYKSKVTVPYTSVTTAWTEYITLGKIKVEELIHRIGTVTENSGFDITSARAAYTQLIKEDPNVQINNYHLLVNAENAFKAYAVTSCIQRIDEILTPITLASKESIEAARAEYNALGEEEKKKITNLQKLLDAEAELNELMIVENVIQLITNVDTSHAESMKEALAAYEALTEEQKSKVTNADRISYIKVTLTIVLIDSIGTVTPSSKPAIDEAEDMYNRLNIAEQEQVTNYTILITAKEKFEELMNSRIECTFDGAPSEPSISVVGKYGTTGATIDGTTYNKGLKMESSTLVSFSIEISRTLTLHMTAGKIVEVDGVAYTADSNGVITLQLAAGLHTIAKGKKGTTSTLLYALFLQ